MPVQTAHGRGEAMPLDLEGLMGPIDMTAVARLALAALLGGLIGWEREKHGRAAGMRTHLLLCLGCALVMLVSLYIPTLFADYRSDSILRADPGRIVAHVLSGLGFLGAGAIVTLGRWVRGLTTAACVWVTAAIGLAVGCGYVFVALCTFVIVMFSLHTLRIWERQIRRQDRYARLELRFDDSERHVDAIREVLSDNGFDLLEYQLDRDADETRYRLQVRYITEHDIEHVTSQMDEALSEEGLTGIRWL
jgi:putative Mg2+ transporter-C (MgtC) family protein